MFYTRTLADLYLRQGYLSEAEKAFGVLLEKEPGHPGYLSSLTLIAQRRHEEKKQALVDLVRTWASLLHKASPCSDLEA